MKKYAIFGGSFDPPHICHERIVELCLRELEVDTVFVVPTFLSPFKNSFAAPPEVRYEWLCKIFDRYPSGVEVSDVEIKKQRSVFMVETAAEISAKVGKQSCDKIYLIIGADNLKDFKKWRDYEKLLKLAEPIVISRNGIISKEHKTFLLDCDASSSGFRESLDEGIIPSVVRDEVVKFYKGKI